MVQKSLDLKLANIHADPLRAKDFILADAKDPDMALSIGGPGKSSSSPTGFRSLQEFRDIITSRSWKRPWSISCSCRPAPTRH